MVLRAFKLLKNGRLNAEKSAYFIIKKGADKMEGIDLTPIINAVIMLITVIITAFLIPWIKSKTTESQQCSMISWARIAVAAAEQIFTGDGRGEEKKQYVQNFLEEHGFKIDEASVSNLIEAAVQELKSGKLTLK
mgnify:CR=1 FL=1